MKRVLTFLFTCSAIALCLALGKLINHYIGGLPASLYGMLIFAAALASDLLKPEQHAQALGKILYFMPVVFLPVCVGLVQYQGLIVEFGWPLLITGLLTAFATLLVAGFVASKIMPDDQHD